MRMMRRTAFALLLAVVGVVACGCGAEPGTEPGLDTPLRTFGVDGWVIDMVFTPGGDGLVVGSAIDWLPGRKPARRSLTPPPPPSMLKYVTVLRLADGEALRALGLYAEATGMVFTHDRRHVLFTGLVEGPEPRDWTSAPSRLSMVRIDDGSEVREFPSDATPLGLDVTADGHYVVAAIRLPEHAHQVAVWSLASGDEVRSFDASSPHVRVSPDGSYVLAGAELLRMADGEHVTTLPHIRYADAYREERSAAFTPDGQYVICAAGGFDVSSSDSMTLGAWSIPDGALVKVLKGHTQEVRDVAVTPDGRYAISGGADGKLFVWQIGGAWELVRAIRAHDTTITCVVVTPDGRHILSGDGYGTIHVWPIEERTDAARIVNP